MHPHTKQQILQCSNIGSKHTNAHSTYTQSWYIYIHIYIYIYPHGKQSTTHDPHPLYEGQTIMAKDNLKAKDNIKDTWVQTAAKDYRKEHL